MPGLGQVLDRLISTPHLARKLKNQQGTVRVVAMGQEIEVKYKRDQGGLSFEAPVSEETALPVPKAKR